LFSDPRFTQFATASWGTPSHHPLSILSPKPTTKCHETVPTSWRLRHGPNTDRAALQRDIAVLALRARLALRERRLERADQVRPRPSRLDHVVDVPSLGGRVRVREPLLVVGDQLGPPRI